jgi:DNA-directed RNA polymerase specialized sigma24 family protein
MREILAGQELFERLNNADWKTILPQLHYYALNKLRRFAFLEEMYDVNGQAAQLADEAIRLVWEEQRKWNTTYYTELYDFLKGIVDSLISNFINSKEVELTVSLPEEDGNGISHATGDPEQAYIRRETEAEIMAILKADEKAALVFDCLKDGLKPREIAIELGWSAQDVYNILKRVQRKLTEYAKLK